MNLEVYRGFGCSLIFDDMISSFTSEQKVRGKIFPQKFGPFRYRLASEFWRFCF